MDRLSCGPSVVRRAPYFNDTETGAIMEFYMPRNGSVGWPSKRGVCSMKN